MRRRDEEAEPMEWADRAPGEECLLQHSSLQGRGVGTQPVRGKVQGSLATLLHTLLVPIDGAPVAVSELVQEVAVMR